MPDGEEVRYHVEHLGDGSLHFVGPCPGCYMRARNSGESLEAATQETRCRWTVKRDELELDSQSRITTQRKYRHIGCFEGRVQHDAWEEIETRDDPRRWDMAL